ncbi:MAG: hypothetical protein Q9157_001026 [Trypethelium eluteriae]
MSTEPRTPYRRKGNIPSRNRARGAFVNGAWHCKRIFLPYESQLITVGDCEPRLPAEHFKVKKEGPNHVYTCQSKKCGFFLWDEDAKPREEAAILTNSRNEPKKPNRQDSSSTLRNDPSSAGTLPSPPPSTNTGRGLKRKVDFDEDDSFNWHLTGEESEQLVQAVDAATPAKSRDELLMTPKRRKLPWMRDNDTSPSAGSIKEAFSTPSNKTITTPSDRLLTASSRQQAPDTTPTPARFRNADVPSTGVDHLEEEILSVLQERKIRVDQATTHAIHESFASYDRKVQGFIQG